MQLVHSTLSWKDKHYESKLLSAERFLLKLLSV